MIWQVVEIVKRRAVDKRWTLWLSFLFLLVNENEGKNTKRFTRG